MWSAEDLDWVSKNYPSLKVVEDGIISGRLTFQMLRRDGKYYVNPEPELFEGKASPDFLYLSDSYNIQIRLIGEHNLPMAYETGGKIRQAGLKYKKSMTDMHVYSEGGLCVAPSMVIDRAYSEGFNLAHFTEQYLIPYLFAQSHYAETGNWLWGELAHGYLGLLQWLGRLENWYDDDIEITYKWLMFHKDRPDAIKALGIRWRGHQKCICGSGKKMRNCHPEIKRALSAIRIAINNGTLDTSKYDESED